MSSKRHLRRKSCEGKARHGSYNAAVLQMKHSRTTGLNAYKCHCCDGWHVGHVQNRQRRVEIIVRMGIGL